MNTRINLAIIVAAISVLLAYMIHTPLTQYPLSKTADPYAYFRTDPRFFNFLNTCQEMEKNLGPISCTEENSKLYAQKAKDLFNFQGVLSQSDGHLQQNACVAWPNIMSVVTNPSYKKVFDEALASERNAADTYAVFYHAQQNMYYWLELLYTKLWERKYNKRLDDYLFLRFPNEQNPEIVIEELQEGSLIRQHWLTHGRKEHQTTDQISPHILSTNYALFANSKNHLCSSMRYLVHNFNDADPKLTAQDVAEKFMHVELYNQYKLQLDELEQEFKTIVLQSVLLQILIPFHLLKEHTYFSMQGSYKTSIYIYDKVIDDVFTILHTLKTNPAAFTESDIPVISIIVTPDSLHTLLEQGAQVKVFGTFDKNELSKVLQKLEAFIKQLTL